MSVLYVVATPIGNMEDLSPRALRILGEVSLIAAEDTRHTGAMLKRLGVETPLISNHGFNERARVSRLLDALGNGDVALVTDAGTPAVSDPGAVLVRAAADAGHRVIPIPGPSAVTAAVSASGLVEGPFLFLGFLSRTQSELLATLEKGLALGVPLVFYERGNRIEDLVRQIGERAPNRALVIFRELTKVHEEAIRATAQEMPDRLSCATLKGEFVLVVGAGVEAPDIDLDALIRERLTDGQRPSDIARELARASDTPRSEIYERVLALSKAAQGA